MPMLSRRSGVSATAAATLAGTLLASTAAWAADVTYQRLVNPEPQNWLTHYGDYGSQRYSPLDTINKDNIKNLKLMYALPLGGKSARGKH